MAVDGRAFLQADKVPIAVLSQVYFLYINFVHACNRMRLMGAENQQTRPVCVRARVRACVCVYILCVMVMLPTLFFLADGHILEGYFLKWSNLLARGFYSNTGSLLGSMIQGIQSIPVSAEEWNCTFSVVLTDERKHTLYVMCIVISSQEPAFAINWLRLLSFVQWLKSVPLTAYRNGFCLPAPPKSMNECGQDVFRITLHVEGVYQIWLTVTYC